MVSTLIGDGLGIPSVGDIFYFANSRRVAHISNLYLQPGLLHVVALVAQWIARWIPNPKVRGSNPRWGILFKRLVVESKH